MWGSGDPEEVRARHEELLREADEMRMLRLARVESEPRSGGREVVIRWGMEEDEARISALLDLNGMPRWIAFEERFVVAEEDGEVVAAVRYRTSSKRLALGLLVADPWRGERRLAVALYAGARRLARELGVTEVTVGTAKWGRGYPREAGYRRRMDGWSWDAGHEEEAESCEKERRGWLRSALAVLHLPSRGAFRG
jgi:hypothetical protein